MKIKRTYESAYIERSDLKPGDLFCMRTNGGYIYMQCAEGAVCLSTGTYIEDSPHTRDMKVISLEGTLTISVKQHLPLRLSRETMMKTIRGWSAQITMNDLRSGELFAFVDSPIGAHLYCGNGYYVCLETGDLFHNTNKALQVILLDGELTVALARNALYNPNKEQD